MYIVVNTRYDHEMLQHCSIMQPLVPTHTMITKCYNTVVYYHKLLQHAFSLLTYYIICVKLYITITIKTYIHLSVTCTV